MKPVDTCNAFVPDEMITVAPNREGKLSSLTFAVRSFTMSKDLSRAPEIRAGKIPIR